MNRENGCEARIGQALDGRLSDLRRLWWLEEKSERDPELGTLGEYALCFDYVAPHTFDDQREGYFRFQISYGGPSDEFRFFVNPDLSCHRIEYWFLDWFDGASRTLASDDREFVLRIWTWLEEGGAAHAALARASP